MNSPVSLHQEFHQTSPTRSSPGMTNWIHSPAMRESQTFTHQHSLITSSTKLPRNSPMGLSKECSQVPPQGASHGTFPWAHLMISQGFSSRKQAASRGHETRLRTLCGSSTGNSTRNPSRKHSRKQCRKLSRKHVRKSPENVSPFSVVFLGASGRKSHISFRSVFGPFFGGQPGRV